MKEAFRVKLSVAAQKDIVSAIAFYDSVSEIQGTRILRELNLRLLKLETNWAFHQIKYKNVRHARIEHFPYWVHFIVLEKQKKIRVLFVHHEKQRPKV